MAKLLNGIAASGGIVIAPVHLLSYGKPPVKDQKTTDVNHEVERLHDSFRITATELEQIIQQATRNYGKQIKGPLEQQLVILRDWEFPALIGRLIVSQKVTAISAIENGLATTLARIDQTTRTGHRQAIAYQDVAQRLITHLQPQKNEQLDHRAIVVSHEVSPSLVASFNPQLVAGVITDNGGATAHSALLTAELGIPAVVGTKAATQIAKEDMVAIIDGEHGKVIFQPTPQEIDHYQQLAAQYQQQQQSLGAYRDLATVTADGNRVHVAANIALPDELNQLIKSGAEGIGLYRSEFLFLNVDHRVTEDEQVANYKAALLAMPHDRVVIRVQDLGADKQPRFGQERNVKLFSQRGLRWLLKQEPILRTQLRALLRASVYGHLGIMFPFVTTIDEFQRALAILDQERRLLEEQGHAVANNVEVGMMIETPAAVLMADQFAKYADFFSIGSNDLVQYLFAEDRTDSSNQHYVALNPAVLRAIKQVIQAAHAEGKWISLCGEMATLKLAQPLVLAMGIDEFSLPLPAILPLKQRLQNLSVRQLQPLVKQVLMMENDDEVAEVVNKWLRRHQKK
ncbi:phosphoenolpyruvate--protein phosphotransferase [Lactobacillus alvi]|uniref:Phosphoenolpyruvate-protein phosphotransferase n=1 Tax=Limosilactobacillus alvi TaxID=990412 RepID=A0ABS2EQU1_9LACO|nr:phosphoenolpyruvate--protein phosphotransferase [Limosilactobacillus alvi]MBM6754590.1 phosphoenolpyruvate--protein phosphotransferase [Limosilactobacillus alvi]